MIELPVIDDYEDLFVNNTPLLDTRASVEFSRGAFPNAEHAPLMTDDERKKVGTCYQKFGKEAAIDLGNRLVNGKVKEKRISYADSKILKSIIVRLTIPKTVINHDEEYPWIAGMFDHSPMVAASAVLTSLRSDIISVDIWKKF